MSNQSISQQETRNDVVRIALLSVNDRSESKDNSFNEELPSPRAITSDTRSLSNHVDKQISDRQKDLMEQLTLLIELIYTIFNRDPIDRGVFANLRPQEIKLFLSILFKKMKKDYYQDYMVIEQLTLQGKFNQASDLIEKIFSTAFTVKRNDESRKYIFKNTVKLMKQEFYNNPFNKPLSWNKMTKDEKEALFWEQTCLDFCEKESLPLSCFYDPINDSFFDNLYFKNLRLSYFCIILECPAFNKSFYANMNRIREIKINEIKEKLNKSFLYLIEKSKTDDYLEFLDICSEGIKTNKFNGLKLPWSINEIDTALAYCSKLETLLKKKKYSTEKLLLPEFYEVVAPQRMERRAKKEEKRRNKKIGKRKGKRSK